MDEARLAVARKFATQYGAQDTVKHAGFNTYSFQFEVDYGKDTEPMLSTFIVAVEPFEDQARFYNENFDDMPWDVPVAPLSHVTRTVEPSELFDATPEFWQLVASWWDCNESNRQYVFDGYVVYYI